MALTTCRIAGTRIVTRALVTLLLSLTAACDGEIPLGSGNTDDPSTSSPDGDGVCEPIADEPLGATTAVTVRNDRSVPVRIGQPLCESSARFQITSLDGELANPVDACGDYCSIPDPDTWQCAAGCLPGPVLQLQPGATVSLGSWSGRLWEQSALPDDCGEHAGRECFHGLTAASGELRLAVTLEELDAEAACPADAPSCEVNEEFAGGLTAEVLFDAASSSIEVVIAE